MSQTIKLFEILARSLVDSYKKNEFDNFVRSEKELIDQIKYMHDEIDTKTCGGYGK